MKGCVWTYRTKPVCPAAQLCPTVCDPMGCSPWASSVHWILQARILKWVAVSFCRGSSWPKDWTQDSWIAGRFFTIWATGKSQSHSVVSHSLWPHELYSPWNSPGQNTRVGNLSLFQGSNPGLPHCRQILLPAEPQGKPKNTGVGSLSLLQKIFPTQESNWGLLYCRHILYQLSYQGSPGNYYLRIKIK